MKPEGELGGFDKSLLDQFDDTLAAVHHLSKGTRHLSLEHHSFIDFETGQMKVIIAPHDAHALRGSNDVPCDAYCQKLDGAFLDFYSSDECALEPVCTKEQRLTIVQFGTFTKHVLRSSSSTIRLRTSMDVRGASYPKLSSFVASQQLSFRTSTDFDRASIFRINLSVASGPSPQGNLGSAI
jgi:hypothetical protein